MTRRTVALFHSDWPAGGLERPTGVRPLQQYRYAIWYKANPRSAAYMCALLQERFPDAVWLDLQEQPDWTSIVSKAEAIVLLYPDAIGLGFGAIERALFAHVPQGTVVEVINGRRRAFRLDGLTRMRLRLRRFLERSMLVELLFIPVFVAMTPVLWAVDAIRGRT